MPRKKAAPETEPEEIGEGKAEAGEAETQTRAIVQYQDSSVVDVHPEIVKKKLESIKVFQQLVRSNMIEGQDFGVIPGTPKPTLLKPGAEKIIKLMNLADVITIEDKIEDWKEGFFYYRAKCELVSLLSNQVVATGIGSCNSKEDKYRWRWVPEQYLTEDQKLRKESVPFKTRRSYGQDFTVYRFENEEIFTQVNTLLKMAKKRALVDAALSVGRLSNLFTQDIEDTGSSDSFFDQSPRTKQEDAPRRKPGPKPKDREAEPPPPAKAQTDTPAAPPLDKKEQVKESYPMVQITLSNGSKVSVTQFGALDYFKAIKESMQKESGDEAMYYATLEQFGFKHSREIPLENIPDVWDTMVAIWKMYRDKKK